MARLSDTDRAARYAMLVAGAMIAEQVGGKATRDALFLSNFSVTALPTMLIAGSLLSIAVAIVAARAFAARGPAGFIPRYFAASGALMLGEWALWPVAHALVAVLFYLHCAAFGAVLISGFWSLLNESFDPRTAKKRISRIAAGGTLGGLIGGVLAERVGASLDLATMLPILAGLHFLCAWLVRGLRPLPGATAVQDAASAGDQGALGDRAEEDAGAAPADPTWRGVKLLTDVPYLRNLALIIVIVSIAGAIVDYVFKAYASEAMQRGPDLMRFFAIFYTAVAFVTFAVQTGLGRRTLEKFGLARMVGALPLAVGAGSVGALVVPGLGSAAALKGVTATLENSLFRSGYELVFTPIPPAEKRLSKSIIDVAFTRLGDALGGGIVQLVLLVAGAFAISALLGLGVAVAIVGIVVASRLQGGYVQALEKNLLSRKLILDPADALDRTTRETLLQSLSSLRLSQVLPQMTERLHAAFIDRINDESGGSTGGAAGRSVAGTDLATTAAGRGPVAADRGTVAIDRGAPPAGDAAHADPVVQILADLRSGNPSRVVRGLRKNTPLPLETVPVAISLLAWDLVARDAVKALRDLAPRIVGQLTDVLLDPEEEFAIRRRVPRILSVERSARAVDGLVRGLDDSRFEVRYQCGLGLARLHTTGPDLAMPRDALYEVVLRETRVGKGVWETHRLLDQWADGESAGESDTELPFAEVALRERSSRSLEHVFRLLSLVLPPQPLQIAFRALHTDDPGLRGTALEYLENVLPTGVRDALWPHLEDRRPSPAAATRSQEEALSNLLNSSQSILINLEEIRRRHESRAPRSPRPAGEE